MKLTDLLDQIDRLDQQATKGPWAVWPQMDDDGATYPEYIEGPKNDLFGARGWDDKHYIQEIPEMTMDDAEFIALARTVLPQLAQALRAVTDLEDESLDGDLQGYEIDQYVGHNQALRSVREAINDALETDGG